MRYRFKLIGLVAVLLTTTAIGQVAPASRVWDRSVSPGIGYRMEIETNPARMSVGLQLDLQRIQAESRLMRDLIFDSTATNGRDVLSAAVARTGALGGINGDFFQWGSDPGGDPQGLMVWGGELLSTPDSRSRAAALGWGPQVTFEMAVPSWSGELAVGPDRKPLTALNARAGRDALVLNTDLTQEVYAQEPASIAMLWVGPARPGVQGRLEGVVVQIAASVGRVRVPRGYALLMGTGSHKTWVESLQMGARVSASWKTEGFDWDRIHNVMGGGPILLRNGEYVGPGAGNDNFIDTRHPRTAVGRTADGRVWYVVIDGRQTMSVGATLRETAEVLRRWGCVDAINLDGGGSSTLNVFGATLNRPSGGQERAISNGILFFGERLPAPTGELRLELPASLKVGERAAVRVFAGEAVVPPDQALFVAHGAGWMDPDGWLTGASVGEARITAVVQGRRITGVVGVQ